MGQFRCWCCCKSCHKAGSGKQFKLTILHDTPGPEIVKYANEKKT